MYTCTLQVLFESVLRLILTLHCDTKMLKQNDTQSARAESTVKGVNLRWKYVFLYLLRSLLLYLCYVFRAQINKNAGCETLVFLQQVKCSNLKYIIFAFLD